MNEPPEKPVPSVKGFRAKLLIAMMLVISAITGVVLLLALREANANVRTALQRDFESSLATMRETTTLRRKSLVQRCRALARKPRIHAALEAEAYDLLYPSAHDALQGLMLSQDERSEALQATFYRFLDSEGAIIPVDGVVDAGALAAEEAAAVALPALPEREQLGYLLRENDSGSTETLEILAMPVIAEGTGEAISAVVLGFKSTDLTEGSGDGKLHRGIWSQGSLSMPGLPETARAAVAKVMARQSPGADASREIRIAGVPHLVFAEVLNEGSGYPRVTEVSVYPLADLAATRRRLVREILLGGAVLLLGGLAASHRLSRRLAIPVEQLAVNRAALQKTLDELRAAEEQLIQSEKMAALGTLTGGMMHEIYNPLNFARTALHVFKQTSAELPGEQRVELEDLAGDIEEGLGRILGIVSQLEVFVKPNLQASDAVALTEAVAGARQLLAGQIKQGNVRLDSEVGADHFLRGDRNQLTLVFLNLIKNALDAHESNRKARRDDPFITVSARADDDLVSIVVRDNATGIAPENLRRVFDPFFTTKAPDEGRGLGLSAVYRVVTAHGGSIRVESTPGVGTEFLLELPRAAAPKQPSSRSKPAPSLAT